MRKTEAMTLEEMESISGGFSAHEAEIIFAKVKCPVYGCSFECSSFGELNVHMRTCHNNHIRKQL